MNYSRISWIMHLNLTTEFGGSWSGFTKLMEGIYICTYYIYVVIVFCFSHTFCSTSPSLNSLSKWAGTPQSALSLIADA